LAESVEVENKRVLVLIALVVPRALLENGDDNDDEKFKNVRREAKAAVVRFPIISRDTNPIEV
jgi:hypothetical protein